VSVVLTTHSYHSLENDDWTAALSSAILQAELVAERYLLSPKTVGPVALLAAETDGRKTVG
jgi:hypothetical protein